MRGYCRFSLVGLCVAAIAFAAVAQNKTITVKGKVVDSATGAAVQQALILLLDSETLDIDMNKLAQYQFDTAFSDQNGEINYSMTVTQKALFLFFGIIKQNYQIYYSAAGILTATVNIGTIKLQPAGLAPKDTVMVSGKVVDSANGGAGIGGALVAMSGLGSLDTTGNTVLTNGDGTFSKQVIIGKSPLGSILGYSISKQGYTTLMGQKQVTSKQVDLGTLALKRNSDVMPGVAVSPGLQGADAICAFSLNGRLLYEGPLLELDKALPHRTGITVVRFMRNKATIATKRIMPAK